jgi:hypothetical protein
MSTPFELYLSAVTTLRDVAVPETSGYGALQTLLNSVGGGLSPRVDVITHPVDVGAGIPDFGVFEHGQPADQLPHRGVIEAKGVHAPLHEIVQSEQVARYAQRYGQVLVTNYYQFQLVRRDESGVRADERFDLAESPAAFWQAAAAPHTFAAARAADLAAYLGRALARSAPLATPQDVAQMLASYARVARARVEAGANRSTGSPPSAASSKTRSASSFRAQMAKPSSALP